MWSAPGIGHLAVILFICSPFYGCRILAPRVLLWVVGNADQFDLASHLQGAGRSKIERLLLLLRDCFAALGRC